eukprot:m51a1_g7369 hypothetical protein (75) ;mRNA; r:64456-64798
MASSHSTPDWAQDSELDSARTPRLRRRAATRGAYAWGFSAVDLADLARAGARPVCLPRPPPAGSVACRPMPTER